MSWRAGRGWRSMTRLSLFAASLLLVAATAEAQPTKIDWAAYGIAAAGDMYSTAQCGYHEATATTPAWGCEEKNPVISWAQPYGDAVMLTIGAAMELVALYLLHRFIGPKWPRAETWIVRGVMGYRIGFAVPWNMKQARRW